METQSLIYLFGPQTRLLMRRYDSACDPSASSPGGSRSVRTNKHNTVQLGELVAAAFDNVAQYSTDPREVSRLGTELVVHILRHAGETLHSPSPRRPPSIEESN